MAASFLSCFLTVCLILSNTTTLTSPIAGQQWTLRPRFIIYYRQNLRISIVLAEPGLVSQSADFQGFPLSKLTLVIILLVGVGRLCLRFHGLADLCNPDLPGGVSADVRSKGLVATDPVDQDCDNRLLTKFNNLVSLIVCNTNLISWKGAFVTIVAIHQDRVSFPGEAC